MNSQCVGVATVLRAWIFGIWALFHSRNYEILMLIRVQRRTSSIPLNRPNSTKEITEVGALLLLDKDRRIIILSQAMSTICNIKTPSVVRLRL